MNSPHLPLLAWADPHAWRHNELQEFISHMVLTPDGIFTIRREGSLTYKRPATAADFERVYGEAIKERIFRGGVELKPRVPYPLLLQALSFFRYVWQQQRREDVLLLYFFEQKQQYRLVHPELRSASQQHVDYGLPATPEDAVRFGSIHSHGREDAYHSPRDHKDDRVSPGIHIIVGNLDRLDQSVKCIASDSTTCFDVPLWDVFVEPDAPPFPPSWYVDLPMEKRRTKHA